MHARSLLIYVALALAGCGGSARPPRVEPTPPIPGPSDAFLLHLTGVVGNLADAAEPAPIDAIAATEPDDSDAIALN